MSKVLNSPLTIIIAAIVIYFGFRFVTQAGMAFMMPQNDGYAMIGGLMILAGGVLTGMWVSNTRKAKGK